MSKYPTRSRAFAFTLNNYTEFDEKFLNVFYGSHLCSYLCYGHEVAPSTGTRHLQGMFCVDKPIALKAAIKLVNNTKFHIEAMLKTSNTKLLREYCIKDGDRIVEMGELPYSGKRSDINEYMDRIKAGATDRELFDEYPNLAFRTHKSLRYVRTIQHDPVEYTFDEVTNVNLRNYAGAYVLIDKFWSGYDGQETVVITDHTLLSNSLYDIFNAGLPTVVPTKYGELPFVSKAVIYVKCCGGQSCRYCPTYRP